MILNAQQSADLSYFERAVWDYGYVCPATVRQAMVAQTCRSARRRFYRGYIAWLASGHNTWEEARRKVRANLGAILLDCSWGEYVRWFMAAGIGLSRTSYH